MPGVDRACTTHHACDCLQAKARQYDALLAKLRDREAAAAFIWRHRQQDEWRHMDETWSEMVDFAEAGDTVALDHIRLCRLEADTILAHLLPEQP